MSTRNLLVTLVFSMPILLFAQKIKPTRAALASINVKNLAPLDIGDEVPDLTFKNIINTPIKNPSISSYRGKLIILDFWASTCSGCIAFLPHMEQLQNLFPGKVQVVLVNTSESKEYVAKRLSKNKNFDPVYGMSKLPSAYNDSAWKILFPHRTIPHHVWIDTAGRVLAITNFYNATPENVRKYFNGESLQLGRKNDKQVDSYSVSHEGLIQPGRPDLPIHFSSVFSRYIPGIGSSSYRKDSATRSVIKGFYGFSPEILYKEAFAAEHEWRAKILFETEKRVFMERIKDGNRIDAWMLANAVSYELRLPIEAEDMMKTYMQDDLNRYFGRTLGVEGKIEKRKLPAYVLVRTAGQAPIAQEYHNDGDYNAYDDRHEFLKCKISVLVEKLSKSIENLNKPIVFLDETGLGELENYFITLTINTGDLSDIEAVRKSLQRHGLDIVFAERTIDILVIKDKI